MIEVHHMVKRYGETTAVDDLSFTVEKGQLFGLIGPDGAGKTSVIRILTSLILPDSGTAVVNSLDVIRDFKTLRKSIGYMPGKFSLYEDLTVKENLSLFAAIFGTTIEENYHLIEDIYSQIEPFKSRKAGDLSGGMKQKLALCCAMIHAPEVIFLDEPTTGVDPVSRKEFWNMLNRLKGEGITILVSTPYMDEASLCDKIALMQQGNIMEVDTPVGIRKNFPVGLWSVSSQKKHELPRDLREYENSRTVFLAGEEIHMTLNSEDINTGEIDSFLRKRGHSDIQIQKIEANIEDCFLELMSE